MPDGFGATQEEIVHYEKVLAQSKVVLTTAKAKPFVQDDFNTEMKKLTEIYSSFPNPHLSQGQPLNQIYDVFKHQHVKGVIGQIEEEIRNGEEALKTMRSIRSGKLRNMFPKK